MFVPLAKPSSRAEAGAENLGLWPCETCRPRRKGLRVKKEKQKLRPYGHGSKSKNASTPSEHQPIPTKIGSKMGGVPKTPIGFDPLPRPSAGRVAGWLAGIAWSGSLWQVDLGVSSNRFPLVSL